MDSDGHEEQKIFPAVPEEDESMHKIGYYRIKTNITVMEKQMAYETEDKGSARAERVETRLMDSIDRRGEKTNFGLLSGSQQLVEIKDESVLRPQVK